MKAIKCEMCGAPLHGTKCEYCGTEYERDKNDDLYPINELGYLQAALNNTNFTQASVSQSCCCDTATQIHLSQANVCSALQSGMITMNEAREGFSRIYGQSNSVSGVNSVIYGRNNTIRRNK